MSSEPYKSRIEVANNSYFVSDSIEKYEANLVKLLEFRSKTTAEISTAQEADAAISFTMNRIKFLSDMKLNSMRSFILRGTMSSIIRGVLSVLFGVALTLVVQHFSLQKESVMSQAQEQKETPKK